MAPYSFDDRNIKWNTLTLPPVGELQHLEAIRKHDLATE